jgi:hypothetical protein
MLQQPPPTKVFPPARAFAAEVVVQATRKKQTDDNPYKKPYKQPSAPKKPKRKSAQQHKYIKPKKTLTARQAAVVIAQGGTVPVTPNYVPPTDSLGNQVWDGRRAGLGWNTAVTGAMATSAGGGCQIQDGGCTGGADSIDHVDDFASTQSEITRYVICDRTHHWDACYKVDVTAVYNNHNDTSGLQWSCTPCNSKKNGAKGLYSNHPSWRGRCQGGCGYTFQGEESEN